MTFKVQTSSHEYVLNETLQGFVCVSVVDLKEREWANSRMGMKVQIVNERLVFEDGNRTTKINIKAFKTK